MENKNIQSFDEHLKQAMEQYQPTPPADVWANISSQIGNVTAVSQVSLFSKITAILTKKAVLISSVAVAVSSVIVYELITDKKEDLATIPTEVITHNPLPENNTFKNNTEDIEIKEKLPETKKEENNIVVNKIKKNTLIVNPELENKNKQNTSDIPVINSDDDKNIFNPKIETRTDKIIKNILKSDNYTTNSSELQVEEIEDKKCNSDAQIINYKINENTYYFDIKTSIDFSNYIWYFGDGFVEFNSKSLSHYYEINQGHEYIVSLVLKKDGCKDSITKKITINSTVKDVNNVFSPNNDGKNDDWNIQINNANFYNLKVIDYKGDLVFETNTTEIKWNGQKHNRGENCGVGSYTYLLVYKINGEENTKTLKGRVDLLR